MPEGIGTYGSQMGRPPEKKKPYKPEYGLGGFFKGLGSVLGGGAMQLGSALGLGGGKSSTSSGAEAIGQPEFATKADLANIQAEIESLKSGAGAVEQPGMADMELKAQQAQQRPLEAGTGFGGMMGGVPGGGMLSGIGGIGGLFGKEGGIVNTNNIARRVMADKGDIVGDMPAIKVTPAEQSERDYPTRPVTGTEGKPIGGTLWTPGSGAFKFIPALFKTGAKYAAKKHAMDGAEVPKENMQSYKPNVTVIIT